MQSHKTIPAWAGQYINSDFVERIEAKVAAIEQKTMGELVILVSKKASYTKNVQAVLFALLVLFLLGFANWYLQHMWFSRFELGAINLLLLLICFLVARFAATWFWLQRLFLHTQDMQDAFIRRAVFEYYDNALYKTKYNTAVLIMVSLLERKAIILASHELNSQVEDKLWDTCIQELTQFAQKKDLGAGFLSVLDKITPILEKKFPLHSSGENSNEISDAVLFKD